MKVPQAPTRKMVSRSIAHGSLDGVTTADAEMLELRLNLCHTSSSKINFEQKNFKFPSRRGARQPDAAARRRLVARVLGVRP